MVMTIGSGRESSSSAPLSEMRMMRTRKTINDPRAENKPTQFRLLRQISHKLYHLCGDMLGLIFHPDGQVTQGDNVVPLRAIAFGEDRRFGNDICVRFIHD